MVLGRFWAIARSVVVIGLLWAVVWLPVGLAQVALDYVRDDHQQKPALGGVLWAAAPGPLLQGFVVGGVFALIVAFAERGRTVDSLSIWRFAAWGLGGVILAPALALAVVAVTADSYGVYLDPVGLLIAAALGGGCAALTLLLAQRGRSQA